jgi:phage-related protein (TIGR01555 family)
MEAERMTRKRRKKPIRRQTNDAFQNPLTRSGVFMPNVLESTQYPLTRFTWDWQTINSLYRSHWIVRRIIDTIPEDMCKNGYKIQSQLAPDRKTRTTARILDGLKLGRLYGGAGALIMLKGQEDELDQPLNLDEIMPGDYKGLLVLDRWSGISPDDKLVDDIDDPEFGLPDTYTLTSDSIERGVRVHHSRILRFIGRPLPYIEQLAENYWGASEIEHIFDELKKRDNVSWNIAMLTFMANLRVMKVEGLSQVLATGSQKAQQDLYNTIQGMNAMMNNNSIQMLGENDSYETHQYTFGGIADVYDRFMMDVAGAAETPVTKLFGRSPSGMNATGESDMQNYYDAIEEKQESELRPVLDKLLPIIMTSTLGAVPDDFDYDFNAVRRPNENEMSDLASKNTDSVTKAFQAGMISQRTALKELRQQSEITGMWSNITDEDIENADDTIQNPNEGMEGMAGLFGGAEGQSKLKNSESEHDAPDVSPSDKR